jgi:hypothetical protein
VNGMARSCRAAWLGPGLALALAGTALAEYPESFKAGIRAKDFHQWPQVVSAMREAIAHQPQSTGENVRIYGNYVAPYIPHYFLGLGLFRQGDWPGAAKAFQEAQAQGTVRGLYRARMEFFQEVSSQHLERSRQTMPSMPGRSGNANSAPRPRPSLSVRADPSGPALQPSEVRRDALDKTVREGRDWLNRGEKLVRDLQAKRRTDPDILTVAEHRLQTASFQLDGCRREGDLEGAERARDDAHAAWEILDDLVRGR